MNTYKHPLPLFASSSFFLSLARSLCWNSHWSCSCLSRSQPCSSYSLSSTRRGSCWANNSKVGWLRAVKENQLHWLFFLFFLVSSSVFLTCNPDSLSVSIVQIYVNLLSSKIAIKAVLAMGNAVNYTNLVLPDCMSGNVPNFWGGNRWRTHNTILSWHWCIDGVIKRRRRVCDTVAAGWDFHKPKTFYN